jgi:hypothetical protein
MIHDQQLPVSVVITNDWFGGFAAAYKKTRRFGTYFEVI